MGDTDKKRRERGLQNRSLGATFFPFNKEASPEQKLLLLGWLFKIK